jgi:hypothetical protein
VIEEVERRYRKAMQAKPARPDEARLATLRAEIENLTDAIACARCARLRRSALI